MKVKIFKIGRIMLSFILLTAMIFPTVLADSITVSALSSDDYITIYFKNTSNWSTVNVHFWSDAEGITSTWPGTPITSTETIAYKLDDDSAVVTKYNTTTKLYEVYLKKDYFWDGLIFNSLTSSTAASTIGTNRTINVRNLLINDGNTFVFDSKGGSWQEKRAVPPYIAGDSFSPNNWNAPFQQMLDAGNYYYYNSNVMSDGQTSVLFKVIDRDTWTYASSPPSGDKYCNDDNTKNINATLTIDTSTKDYNEKAEITDTENFDRIQIRVDKDSGDIYAVALKAPIIENTPRIRYYVPYDSWQRDFIMTENDEYYNCTIPTVNAQVYVYDKENGDLSGLGYAGIDATETEYIAKNFNVEFNNIDGNVYKNVKILSSANSGNEIDIRVDKATGLIYGVSGEEGSPAYSKALQIKAKTSNDSSFKSYDTISEDDNSRYYTYTFDAESVELDFIYNNISVTNELTYKTTESKNNGINLYKTEGSDTYTAEIIDKENCDQIKILIDRYTGAVYAEAIKSDITSDDNTVYYLEGRFICKYSDGNAVTVDNNAWSDTSTNIKFNATEKTGVYNIVTNSTVSELTNSNGAPYYFFVRKGTKYPKSALGKYYSPSSNTSLKDISAGEKISVNSGTSCDGGLYFNDKSNDSGKVTIWFDISDSNNPNIYYTLRYDNISAKAMYSSDSENFVDNDEISVSINPEDSIELPEGTKITAPANVEEDGKEYNFIGWISENGTGNFENSASSETTFYPSADNETLIARYKLVYNLTCESSEHGRIETSSSKVAVGESYTIDIIPDEGYMLTSFTINGEEKIQDTDYRTKYTAEMTESSVTIKAAFAETNEVYFYAAVQTTWGDAHKNINVVADGVKLEPVKSFDKNITLYDLNSSTSVASGATFYVSMFKAEEYAEIIIGEPERADGTVDKNCYGHKILSGELKAGSCYYYYSKGSGNNLNGIVDAVTVNSVTCLTENPTVDNPIEITVDIDDCKGKTSGQEDYTVEYDVTDSKGNSYTVIDNKFTPTIAGTYTVKAWAAYGEAKSNIAQCKVAVKGDEPENTELTVEFKYYDRDSDNQMEISDTETVLSVTQPISEDGIEKTLMNAYASVEDKLRKNMNIMCEYYFYLSQSKAVEGVKNQKNYHTPKTDDNDVIVRDRYGIAQYKTYGESYNDDVMKYHTDSYGNTGSSDEWVTYYSGDQIIDEAAAYENPNVVTKVVIWGFNNPRIYHIDMSFADENTSVDNVTGIDDNNVLYVAANSSNYIYDAFYNMSLDSDSDYTNGGYLSHFDISDYYGNVEMPTAIDTITIDDSKYIFDGWYDNTTDEYVKVSSDLNFTNRITTDLILTAVYKDAENSDTKIPFVTVTKSDIEKYSDDEVEKVRLNTIINVFDCDNVDNTAIVYVRLKSTENSDWENNYSNIDIDALSKDIITTLNITDESGNITGRKVAVVTIGTSNTAQVIADCYEVVSDESQADAQAFKVILNNKNRVQFSNSFTAQSARDNGANSAILAFAAVKNGDKWILSNNYIPYINTGK